MELRYKEYVCGGREWNKAAVFEFTLARKLTQTKVEEILHRSSLGCIQDAASHGEDGDWQVDDDRDGQDNQISKDVFPQEKNAAHATIPFQNAQEHTQDNHPEMKNGMKKK